MAALSASRSSWPYSARSATPRWRGRAAAGLSESDIDKLQAALVNSDAANQVLNSVSPDQRTQLLEAGKGVVADATAGAMWVTAALGFPQP